MTTTPLYQIGTFAAGNRLLDPDQRIRPVRPRTAPTRSPRATGPVVAAARRSRPGWSSTPRSRATGGRLVTVNATGCLEVFSTPYPESAWQVPWLHSLFGNAAAVASGVAAALRATGRDDIRVVAQAGDGGTVDIGLGCLSGMFERNDDVLFVCYDNQGYMNTGVQRSGATPPAASTATTRPVGTSVGNAFGTGKSLPLIAMAHEIPYVATATVADLHDLEAKVGEGDVDARCALPARAGAVPARAGDRRPRRPIRVARLATQCGLFPVFEAEHGAVTGVTPIRQPVPVEEYLRPQTRFAHLFARRGTARRGRRAAGRGPTATSPATGCSPRRTS